MRYLAVAALVAAVVAPEVCQAQDALAQEAHAPVSLAVSADGSTVYVAEHLAKRVAFFDTASGTVQGAVAVAECPWGLAVSPDGTRLYVTGAAPAGKVFVIDLGSKSVVQTFDAGHTPVAFAVSPDGSTLYVCNRFDNSVGVYDSAGGAALGKIDRKSVV